jgi:hypothetical protein
MVEAGLGAGFLDEPRGGLRTGHGDELERHHPPQSLVARLVHRPHATSTEQPHELVAVPVTDRKGRRPPHHVRQSIRISRGQRGSNRLCLCRLSIQRRLHAIGRRRPRFRHVVQRITQPPSAFDRRLRRSALTHKVGSHPPTGGRERDTTWPVWDIAFVRSLLRSPYDSWWGNQPLGDTMSLKEALQKFTDGIVDLTNLEVTTYTGKLEQAVDATTGQLNWDEFKPSSGKLVLAAATLVRPNLNTVNFRAAEVEQGDLQTLLALHTAAVESARNGRMALLKMFAGLVPSISGS